MKRLRYDSEVCVELFILIVFLGLVALVSILLDRRWQRRALARQAAQATATFTPVAATNGQPPSLVEQIKVGWHKRMGWHTQAEPDQPKLRAWLMVHLADQPTTQHWVAGLTDTEFAALHQQLAAFCATLQIDPAWLGEPPLAQDPALQAAIQTVVLHYLQAQHQAVGVQAELQAFKTWLTLEQRPYSYEHQPLIHQLYTQVVKAGLAAPARPEALLATEKTRVEHMLHALQTAAAADRRAFYQLLNTITNPPPADGAEPAVAAASAHHRQPATATVA